MPYTITKEFEFSAAHWLVGLPPEHQCSRLHGHNYKVEVQLEAGSLNEVGFVRDYGDLKVIKTFLDTLFDHNNLNEVLVPLQTSAEVIAQVIYLYFAPEIPELVAVAVSETPKTWASYSPFGEVVEVTEAISNVLGRLRYQMRAAHHE